jgi:hypothetical protein
MSLANRPISLNNLQEIAISGGQYYSKYLGSKFKIQGSEKTFSIQPLWIQDSRWKAEGLRIQVFFGILNLEPYLLGFKKSFWDLES